MSRCDFIALSYSPWSEKARWALDHHRVDYREIEHVPMLGAPLLRARLHRPIGRVTVPALVDRGTVYGDSLEIAKHAERIGQGEPMFPEEMHDAIATWNARSETILDAGRALLVQKVPRSTEAMQEALPAQFPAAVRPHLLFMAKMGVRFLEVKYGAADRDAKTERKRISKSLEALRDVLTGPESYVLGRFTHADVVMAVSLQVVRPVSNRWLPLGDATRAAWEEPELADRFADLLEWRDWVYDRHR